MAELISIIVPNRDGREVLPACLDSLERQTRSDAEVIVVDDSSSDGSGKMIKEHYPHVRLVELNRVHGFAGACVKGLEASTGSWIAVLNSDARPRPDWLMEVMKASKEYPSISMVASAVYLEDGSVDSLGIGADRFGMAYLRGHGHWEVEPEVREKGMVEVFGPAGSAALYRRDMIEEVGFFEPDYFAFYEDLDLAFRCRWQGWRCVLAPSARVEHIHSYTVKRVGLNKRRLIQTNRLRTIVRNWPLSWIARYLPWLIGGNFAGVGRALWEGSPLTPFQARKRFLKMLPADLETRKAILKNKKEPPETMEHWLYHRDLTRKQ